MTIPGTLGHTATVQRAKRHGGDYDDSLRQRKIVCDREVDASGHAGRRNSRQSVRSSAGQAQCGPSRGEVYDAHITPEYALAQSGS